METQSFESKIAVEISVVIPVFNERESLSILYEKLCEQLEALNKSFELIFIDDGSTDGSFETLCALYRKDSGPTE